MSASEKVAERAVTEQSPRDAILGYQDFEIIQVTVAEWPGVPVYVREMGGSDLTEFSQLRLATTEGDVHMSAAEVAQAVVCFLCDADGNRLFEAKDAELLAQKRLTALQTILKAGLEVNHLTEEAQAEVGKD